MTPDSVFSNNCQSPGSPVSSIASAEEFVPKKASYDIILAIGGRDTENPQQWSIVISEVNNLSNNTLYEVIPTPNTTSADPIWI